MLTRAHRCRNVSTRLKRCALHQRSLGRRHYALAANLSQPGDKLHGFTVKRIKHVPELELAALHLEHDKTGANHLHIARDDRNNVFAIGFKTNPPDHTGVPHILEHSVLCGSEKYPVRDPFFKMMPRSLQNFMNAFTSQDHTTYPFATTNPQDFKNLMSVYLDATLHPLLKPQDFAQEGWRVGPANVPATLEDAQREDPPDDLVFKGVVYNEMKGSMSSGDMLYAIRHRDHLFPAIENSGGIPQKITNLTHDQLKKFHADHYNPSNALLFSYGDIPLEEHLKEFAPRLDRFERRRVDADERLPIELTKNTPPVTVLGPFDPHLPPDQQYKASISWLMCDTSDVLQTFSLAMIASLLMDGFSSPIYQNTIEMGWGASYSSNTGLDTSGKIAMFSVGLNGMKKPDIGRLEDGLRNTFQAIRRRGFDHGKIEGRLHQIELDLKHKSASFGMGLMSSLTESFFKGTDPLSTVAAEETLAAFREKMKEPGYLENLLEKYLLNDKTFTFIMKPSDNFEADLMAEEAERLASKVSEISAKFATPEAARKAMATQEFELQKLQEDAKKEDLSCLPSVHVGDIPRQQDRSILRSGVVEGSQVQWREAPTNGLTYFRGLLSLESLPSDLRIYLPLFSAAIQRLGTKSLSTEALEDLIKLKTGGIGVGHHVSTSPQDLDTYSEGISFSSQGLDRNVPSMFELLRTLVQETDFDRPDAEAKIREIIKSSASSAIDDIADMGHVYARRFAEAGLTTSARMSEEVNGLTQTRIVLDLASRGDDGGLSDVMDKLKAIQMFALSGGSALRCAITCGAESASANEAALAKFLSAIPQSSTAPSTPDPQIPYSPNTKCFFPLPYQVYYTARSLRTIPYTSPDSAPLQILAQLLTHKHIHHEVREKGGAYGGSASMSSSRGAFSFASYRDPNPLNTLRVVQGVGNWARDRAWTEREMEEAKLSVFQSLDSPKSVDEEGMLKFLTGIDEDMEQQMRERLLDVKPVQVSQVADKYLAQPLEQGQGNIAVLGKVQDWVKDDDDWMRLPMSVNTPSSDNGAEEESPQGEYVVL